MLFRQKLEEELERKQQEFAEFALGQQGELNRYSVLLEKLAASSVAEVLELMASKQADGAIPSSELDDLKSVAAHFAESWENHEQARAWAMPVLKNRTTFAADASQLLLDREINFPAAVIQVGWFENDHTDEGLYTKDVRAEVLSPKTLLESNEQGDYKDVLNAKRLEYEISEAQNFLERAAGWEDRDERIPLAFFDGTPLLPKEILKSNLPNVIRLFRTSEEFRVPLIGFVDISKTNDLRNLLNIFGDAADEEKKVFDAQILHYSSCLKNWGDRSIFFYMHPEKSKRLEEADGMPLSGFVYLKTTASSQPARIDIPTWVYKAGMLDEVIDVIRAETVVGLGYPYPLEAADATAVINASDREVFLKALQNLAEKSNIPFRVSPKPMSKARRR